jgi:hypothetical protein
MFGRSSHIKHIERMVYDIQGGHQARRWVFIGPPGAGKTALLRYAQNALVSRNWLCGYSEASPDAATAIGEFLDDARRALPRSGIGERFHSRLTELNVSFGGLGAGIKLADPGESPTYVKVRDLFTSLGEIAKKSRTGVALFIDEAQALPSQELNLLLRVVRRLDDCPVVILLAGLPSLPKILGGRDKGIFERPTVDLVWYHTIGSLAAEEAFHALADPIRDGGGIINDKEIERMSKFSEGHPLTLHLLGANTWDLADGDLDSQAPIFLSEEHVTAAIKSTSRQLTIAYHEPMWSNCDSSERELLIMLASSEFHLEFMMKSASFPDRDDILYTLRGRGLIETTADDHHFLQFAIPGFSDFIKRQHLGRRID